MSKSSRALDPKQIASSETYSQRPSPRVCVIDASFEKNWLTKQSSPHYYSSTWTNQLDWEVVEIVIHNRLHPNVAAVHCYGQITIRPTTTKLTPLDFQPLIPTWYQSLWVSSLVERHVPRRLLLFSRIEQQRRTVKNEVTHLSVYCHTTNTRRCVIKVSLALFSRNQSVF